MGCWVPVGRVRGFLLSVSWLLVAARGSGLSVCRLVLLAHAGLGCAGRLGWTVRLRGEEIPGYRPGLAAPQPKTTLVFRCEKVQKNPGFTGFLRGLHGAMSKSYRLVAMILNGTLKH